MARREYVYEQDWVKFNEKLVHRGEFIFHFNFKIVGRKNMILENAGRRRRIFTCQENHGESVSAAETENILEEVVLKFKFANILKIAQDENIRKRWRRTHAQQAARHPRRSRMKNPKLNARPLSQSRQAAIYSF